LDSIASALGYTYFASLNPSQYRYVPLYQAKRADISLRPENVYAFETSGLNVDDHIVFLDDLPPATLSTLAAERDLHFALVDHNKLGASYGDKDDSVIAVIDHHQDEGQHKNADPRTIQVPTGSGASLVTDYFVSKLKLKEVPSSLADILLAAILVDTGALKQAPKGKAVEADMRAANFLASCSTLSTSSAISTQSQGDEVELKDLVKDRFKALTSKKFDLSNLGSRDLLRRDYKEYESDVKHIRYGLSTVPLALKDWLAREEVGHSWDTLLEKCDAWGKERDLAIVGVLTSYIGGGGRGAKKADKGEKGRELVFLLRGDEGTVQSLRKLFDSVEQDEVLKVGPLELGKPDFKDEKWNERVVTYQQRNADATRKQVAPAMKKAIQGIE